LNNIKLQLEVNNTECEIKQVDIDIVKSYAEDLNNLLGEADIVESKAFLRSSVVLR
jgi:hypothetical protein